MAGISTTSWLIMAGISYYNLLTRQEASSQQQMRLAHLCEALLQVVDLRIEQQEPDR